MMILISSDGEYIMVNNPEVGNNNAVRSDRTWYFGQYTVVNNAGYTDLEIYLADIAGDFHMLGQAQ